MAARLASERDELIFAETGTAEAQTTRNGHGGRTITMSDSGNAWNNAVVLGHESYRDGYAGSISQQEAETLRAAKGHTEMAIRMMQDGRTGENGLILTQNLNDDIINYISGSDAFSRYVADNYDSSADYWKLMDDGSLKLEDDEKDMCG